MSLALGGLLIYCSRKPVVRYHIVQIIERTSVMACFVGIINNGITHMTCIDNIVCIDNIIYIACMTHMTPP